MSAFRPPTLLGLGFALFLVWVAPAWADRPIALVGEGYGRIEVKSIIEHVLNGMLPQMTYEDCGEFLEASEFPKYRLVVIAGMNATRTYTSDETVQIENYVRQGGKLLLIHQAPKMFSVTDANKSRDAAYLFGRSYYIREAQEASVFQPEAKILEGAFEQVSQPRWLWGNVRLKSPEWESYVGLDDYILVGRRAMDAGVAYYLGSELFRLLSLEKSEPGSGAEGWARILKNIFVDTEK